MQGVSLSSSAISIREFSVFRVVGHRKRMGGRAATGRKRICTEAVPLGRKRVPVVKGWEGRQLRSPQLDIGFLYSGWFCCLRVERRVILYWGHNKRTSHCSNIAGLLLSTGIRNVRRRKRDLFIHSGPVSLHPRLDLHGNCPRLWCETLSCLVRQIRPDKLEWVAEYVRLWFLR